MRTSTFAKIAICAALAAAFALAPAATALADWEIKGRGFGHGVGLSQYGAYGFAKHGWKYKRILRHYYRDTKVKKVKRRKVRVLLGAQSSVAFSGAREACGKRLSKRGDYSLSAGGARVSLMSERGRRIASCGGRAKADGKGRLEISGHGTYRGDLIFDSGSKGSLVINKVGLEGYVKGVVANEVPSSWHKQALRAQAVVARSYGLASEKSGAFDHYDDTRSQVYGGRISETRRTNKAVKRSRRKVVKHKGKVALTYYSSTSGGETESVQYGFPGASPSPYLRSVDDPYDDISPVHRWSVRYSQGAMESRLGGLFRGELEAIDINKTGETPRIVRARVVGSSGSTTVDGPTLRDRLGLRSTWATFEKD